MAEQTSKTGLWLDATGKLVKKAPEGAGTQLVPEGGQVTSEAQVRLDALDADPDAPAVSAAESLGYETGAAPEVENAADTKAVTTAKAPARKSAK